MSLNNPLAKVKMPSESLTEVIQAVPILDSELVRSQYTMQVFIVALFWLNPGITDNQIALAVMNRFPHSSYCRDPITRARMDRSKYNNGRFRCTGNRRIRPENAHYAAAKEDTDGFE